MDDSLLWDAYENAKTDKRRKEMAGEIVWFHHGFFVTYANQTAFSRWPHELKEDYLQEIVLKALELVPKYDRSHQGYEGRSASFCTFVKRYFRGIRWKIERDRMPVQMGVDVRQVKTAAEHAIDTLKSTMHREPTYQEITDHLQSGGRNQKWTVQYVEAALNLPPFVPIEATSSTRNTRTHDEDDHLMADRFTPADPAGRLTAEDVYIEEEDQRAKTELVQALLERIHLNEIERTILLEYLMPPPRKVLDGEVVHPGPKNLAQIGGMYGISRERARQCKCQLLDRFRRELGVIINDAEAEEEPEGDPAPIEGQMVLFDGAERNPAEGENQGNGPQPGRDTTGGSCLRFKSCPAPVPRTAGNGRSQPGQTGHLQMVQIQAFSLTEPVISMAPPPGFEPGTTV